MADTPIFELKNIGRELALMPHKGPKGESTGRYVLRQRNLQARVSSSYILSLRDMSIIHAAMTQELFRARKRSGRKSDGIFDHFREGYTVNTADDAGERDTAGSDEGSAVEVGD